MRVAIDTGGTFTDCVYLAGGALRVLKVRSTPANPALAVLDALAQLGLRGDLLDVRHGTTVATNTMIERTGARVAFVTTAGLEDTIAIGRQTRPSLYDWFAPVPVPLVPAELRFGVPERVSAEGELLRSPDEVELRALREQIAATGAEAIALSLLFSFLRPEHERAVEAALLPLGLPISVSHRIHPEFREYERASTVVVNSYLTPKMSRYLLDLEDQVAERHGGGTVEVMQSSGGIVQARLAAEEPVRTLLSGPAGGAIGAWRVARQSGFDHIIGFDMGGTSTDVFLADVAAGGARRTNESVIAGVPVGVPMLDIHTVGAGGGSLARFDRGGLLHVGPASAGADPGPVCFSRGGVEPTVTDANLLLGRLGASGFLDGAVSLDQRATRARFDACRGPMASAEALAAGILRVIETGMERAIRVISVERGHDPRDFALVAFGGGGPLHACALARALRLGTVLVPPLPGALSAVGILLADGIEDRSRTVMLPGSSLGLIEGRFAALAATFRDLPAETPIGAAIEVGSDVVTEAATLEHSVDLRYQGQGYELNLPYGPATAEAFHELHRHRFGFADVDRPLEIVTLRVRRRIRGPEFALPPQPEIPGDGAQARLGEQPVWFEGVWHATPIYERVRLRPGDAFSGPALIAEYSSTTVLPPSCSLRVDGFGMLVIAVSSDEVRP